MALKQGDAVGPAGAGVVVAYPDRIDVHDGTGALVASGPVAFKADLGLTPVSA